MRNWTTTKSAPSRAACGSGVVANVPCQPRSRRMRSESPPTASRRSALGSSRTRSSTTIRSSTSHRLSTSSGVYVLPPPTTTTLMPTQRNVTSVRVRTRRLRTGRAGLRRGQHQDRCRPRLAARCRPRTGARGAEQPSTRRPGRYRRRAARSPRRGHRCRACARFLVPALSDRGLLLGRHRSPDRRGEAGAGDRRTRVDGPRDPAQRHVRRLTGRHHVVLGHRRRLRHRDELRRRRPRRPDRALPGPGRAVRRLCARRRLARAPRPGPRADAPATAGARPPRCASGWPRSSARPTPRRRSRASTAARSPTPGSSSWPGSCSTPPPTAMHPPARRPISWPTRSPRSSAPPSSASTSATRRWRSSSGAASSTPPTPPSISASLPGSAPPRHGPSSSVSTPRPSWVPRSSASTPLTPLPTPWPHSVAALRSDPEPEPTPRPVGSADS